MTSWRRRLKFDERRLSVAAALAAVLCFAGAAMAQPPGPSVPQPPTVNDREVDLSFIKPGQSTRQEISKQLAMIDAGYGSQHFFWGQWVSSSVNPAWVIEKVVPTSGSQEDSTRIWSQNNVLVTFDDQGTVVRSQVFRQDENGQRQFFDELRKLLQNSSRQELNLPSELPAHEPMGTDLKLTFSEERVTVVKDRSKAIEEIPVKSLARFSIPLAPLRERKKYPPEICADLHTSGGTKPRKLSFCMEGTTLADVIEYLIQYAPPGFQWE